MAYSNALSFTETRSERRCHRPIRNRPSV